MIILTPIDTYQITGRRVVVIDAPADLPESFLGSVVEVGGVARMVLGVEQFVKQVGVWPIRKGERVNVVLGPAVPSAPEASGTEG